MSDEPQTMGASTITREGVTLVTLPRAIKLGGKGFERWFAIDQIQSICAKPGVRAPAHCVYVQMHGESQYGGVLMGCFEDERLAWQEADRLADLVWGNHE